MAAVTCVDGTVKESASDTGQRQPDGRRATPAGTFDQEYSNLCRDFADERESEVPLEAGSIEPGGADGNREGGPAEQMEARSA